LCRAGTYFDARFGARWYRKGPDVTLQGNVDPMILFGSEAQINAAVDEVGAV